MQLKVDQLNRQANEISKSIGKAEDAAEREALKEEGRRLREQTAESQTETGPRAAEALDILHRSIPNMSHPDAPVGVDDQANLRSLQAARRRCRSSTSSRWITSSWARSST